MSVKNRSRRKTNLGVCLFCGLNKFRKSHRDYCSRECRVSLSVLSGKIKVEQDLELEFRNKFRLYGGSMYTTIRWLSIRRNILKRDNYTCLKCGSKENLHVDHIVPVSWCRGGYWRSDNLQTLCGDCNKNKGAKDASNYLPEEHNTGYPERILAGLPLPSKNKIKLLNGRLVVSDNPTTGLKLLERRI